MDTAVDRFEKLLATALPVRVRANAPKPAPPQDEQTHPVSYMRLIIALEGRKTEIFGEDGEIVEWVMTPGDALVVCPDSWLLPRFHTKHRHLGIVPTANALRITFCRCDATRRTPPLITEDAFDVPMPDRSALKQTCDTLCALDVASEQTAARHLIASLLHQIREAAVRPQTPENKGQRTWRAMLAYAHDNCLFPLGRDAAAKALGVSPNYLSRLCRQHGNKTFIDLVTEYRLERAAAMLRSVEVSVAHVARSCGFSDPGYFIRRFRRAFGVTPGDYRKAPNRRR